MTVLATGGSTSRPSGQRATPRWTYLPFGHDALALIRWTLRVVHSWPLCPGCGSPLQGGTAFLPEESRQLVVVRCDPCRRIALIPTADPVPPPR